MPTTEQLESSLAQENITHQTFGISKKAYDGVIAFQLEKHGFAGALRIIKKQVATLEAVRH
ncbi:hypothetical protein [Kiloniella laminariae]|uniref:Uncharacterized protein n=1 Tax=Kiloniella laminariae TaxID=454162 RepID=A0ABT4LP20_9PROT|nr:hypothetical protein [Kiloniella laminariae]MCZ4282868.1 hypothetical protein [Kiloniella laminariae]